LLNIWADWEIWKAFARVQVVSQTAYSSSVYSNVPFFSTACRGRSTRRGQTEAVVDAGHSDLLVAAPAPGILEIGCALGDNDW
jgi:hypothetical protein